MEFESTTFVFLMAVDPPPDLSDEERARIHAEHRAYLTELTIDGPMIIAGPFGEQTDESFRGLCVMSVERDDALALMSLDPAVRAGIFHCEAANWYRIAGSASFRQPDVSSTAASDG